MHNWPLVQMVQTMPPFLPGRGWGVSFAVDRGVFTILFARWEMAVDGKPHTLLFGWNWYSTLPRPIFFYSPVRLFDLSMLVGPAFARDYRPFSLTLILFMYLAVFSVAETMYAVSSKNGKHGVPALRKSHILPYPLISFRTSFSHPFRLTILYVRSTTARLEQEQKPWETIA